MADEICRRIASGESLNAICKSDHLPDEVTVRGWALDDREGFFAKYARAVQIRAERRTEEIHELCDAPPVLDADGKVDGGEVALRRLRVDTRKWYASKVLPKVYGDKVALEHAGGFTVEVVTNVTDPKPKPKPK